MSEIKYCVDCKHIGKNHSGDPLRYKCFSPHNINLIGIDYVTGEEYKTYHHGNCYHARLPNPTNCCGPDAAWFESAPPKAPEPALPTPRSITSRDTAVDLLGQLGKM